MFVVANWGRLEMCGVQDGCICNRAEQKDERNVCACLCESERKREREREKMEGVGTHK